MIKVSNDFKLFLSVFLAVIFPVVIFCVVLSLASCQVTVEGVQSLDGDVTVPVLTELIQNGKEQLELCFSETVALAELKLYKDEVLLCQEDKLSLQFQGNKACICVAQDVSLQAGETYGLSGVATDSVGNSLAFYIPFYGYNENVPILVLSEVRTTNTKPKVEFVELFALTSGNTAGVTLYNANDDSFGEYVLPAAEVKAGEYIVVHFRTYEEYAEDCVNETNNDLNQSTAPDSCENARDFWIPGEKARLGNSDVILLRERSGGMLMDMVAFAEEDLSEWKKDVFALAIKEGIEDGAWHGGIEVNQVASSEGITQTRTISRQNIPLLRAAIDNGQELPKNDASCWLVTKTSSASPGKENSNEAYY